MILPLRSERAQISSLRLCILCCLIVTITSAVSYVLLPRSEASNEPDSSSSTAGGPDQVNATAGLDQAKASNAAIESYGQLPLSFEANRGQLDSRVKFIARGQGYGIFLTSQSAVVRLARSVNSQTVNATRSDAEAVQPRSDEEVGTVTMRFNGAKSVSHPVGLDELPGKSNYFIGNNPSNWRTNISQYSKIRYRNIYPGIDLVYYGNQRQLEYDLIVAPGRSSRQIRMSFEGTQKIAVDSGGNLLLTTKVGDIQLRKPFAYQDVKGTRKEIQAGYLVNGDEVRFEVGAYDRTLPLKIDPVIVYSSFIGGTSLDQGLGIAVDSQGSAYLTGSTSSTDFPVAGAFQAVKDSVADAFIVKLNPAGTALVYSTYLGGNGDDNGNAIAVDSDGNAYVTGLTGSGSFPRTSGVFQDAKDGFLDAFVTKLNPSGSALVYSTFIGGDNSDTGFGIAVDNSNRAVVVGRTDSTRFRTLSLPNQRSGNPVYQSPDAGAHWSSSSAGLTASSVNCLTQDPTTASILYACTTIGVFKSVNAGASWNVTGSGAPVNAPLSTNALVIDPSNSSVIYAAATTGIYKSTNGGGSYTQKNTGLSSLIVFALAVDPNAPSILYAGTTFGVFKTTDGGDSWVEINNGTNSSRVNKIVIDPSQNPAQTIYLGMSNRGVLKTTNGGALWTPINTGLNNFAQINALAIDPLNSSTLYAGVPGAPSAVYKTINGGTTWIPSGTGLTTTIEGQSFPPSVNNLAVDPINSANIYATTLSGGIFKSNNSAGTWNQSNTGFANVTATAIAIDRTNNSNLYAATSIGNDAFAIRLDTSGNLDYLMNFGGDESDEARAVAVDSTGNAYLTGITSSNNLPVINAFQPTNRGATDAFVAKLNSSGSAFSYLTYLGGSSADQARGIAVRGDSAFVIGSTSSSNFPVANALQNNIAFGPDAFVTKLTPAGNALDFSTYLGGTGSDQAFSIAVDGVGNTFVTGITNSPDFPIVSAPQSTLAGNSDAFVTKLNPAGSAISYSTYLGGTATDQGNGIVVDSSGNAYVIGTTSSATFPTAGPLYPYKGNTDAFVTKLAAAADVKVSITGSPNSTPYGSNLTYTIVVSNAGEIPAEHVTLSNTVLSGTGIVSINTSRGTCSGNRFITCDFSTLDPGASATVTLVVLPPALTTMTDTAVVATTTPDATNSNNTATLNTPVVFTDLMVKNTSALRLVEVGGVNTYIVTVTNKGPAAATTITVTDNLPPQLTFVSCTSTGSGVCGGSGNNRTITVPSLEVGASFTATIAARVNNSVTPATVISNIASITSVIPDINPNNDAQTATTTVKAAASTPAQNGLIAFHSDAGSGTSGTNDVYITNADGSGQTNITSEDLQDNKQPVWSPDGSKIAYIATSTIDDSGVWIMNADGTGQTKVTSSRNSSNDQTPTWSPDGTRIAFGGLRAPDFNFGVFVVDIDGTNLKRLVNGNDPAWSPDGTRIAFGNGFGIGMMYADGSDVKTISLPRVPFPGFGWSPDSSKLVISLPENTSAENALYIVNADGTGLVKINNTDGGRNPSWSPDGSKIVFNAFTTTGGLPGGCYTININGTGLTRINGSLPNINYPNWQRRQPNASPLPPTINISGRLTNSANGTGAFASVKVTGTQTRTVGTDFNGDYRIWNLPAGGNYTVAPVITGGTTSSPTNRVFNGPTTDQTNADFSLTFPPPQPITGFVKDSNGVPLQNVRVGIRNSFPTSDTFTDSNGFFSFNAFPGFQAFLLCFPEGATANYIFEPLSIFIQNNSGNNFIGRPKTASISGTVTVGGVGKSGIQVSTGSPQFQSTTTDANGNYTFNGVGEGVTVTVTVNSQTYPFTPGSQTLTVNGQKTGVNFAAPLNQFLIFGQVSNNNGSGIAGATVTLSGATNAVIQTDNGGNYSFGPLPANVGYTVTVTKPGYTFAGPVANTQNLTSNTQFNFSGFPNSLQFYFDSTNVSVGETDGKVSLVVVRSGFLTDTLKVDFRTNDATAGQRTDYTATLGTLTFAPQEQAKTIVVPINDDAYVEGDETFTVTLLNPVGAFVGEAGTAVVTIQNDDTAAPTVNPLDNAAFYARQHYLDFLNRIPDASGLTFWSEQVSDCGLDTSCTEVRRINVSAAFFLSTEFQETGYLVERLYKTAYGDATGTSNFGPTHQLPVPIIRFNEFLPDTQHIGNNLIVGQPGWEQLLENNKVAFVSEFVARQRFVTAFPTSMTPDQFVDSLFNNTGVTPSASDRGLAISEFAGATNTVDAAARGRALRRIAENPTFRQQEFNRAFVLMQYLGYLRRNPNDPQDTDYSGYDFWLTKLNQFNGNFVNAEMVKAFITSSEYRQRFGP